MLASMIFGACPAQQRYMVFANGYRGLDHDHETTSNKASLSPAGYWFNYDDTLVARFAPATPVYIDGHHPLSTSVHHTKGRVYISYLLSRFCFWRGEGRVLNDAPNAQGFAQRVANGRICGDSLLRLIQGTPYSTSAMLDTVDIVCHSMGYAYALGVIDALQGKVVFGKMLILAPESPTFAGRDWSMFEEVWQYGSQRTGPGADAIWRQDGIAPQNPVLGIESLPPGRGGRVYIPKHAPHGFVKSHHLSWYQWVFDIQPDDWGYFGR